MRHPAIFFAFCVYTMSLLVAVKGSGARQTTKQLTRADAAPGAQLRGWCVHAVGGNSGTSTLTAARRESIRKAHNSKARSSATRCPLHVSSWKAKLARQCGLGTAARVPAPPRVPAPAPQVPAPVAQVPVAPPMTAQAQLQSFMTQLDDNRDGMNDGAYLTVANALLNAHRRIGGA